MMLYYLDGNENKKAAPNQNYARELLELFSIGKGPLAGPGDYTNYSEEDIVQAAKVLTGWIYYSPAYLTATEGKYTLENSVLTHFSPPFHDSTPKTFTSHFNNTTIGGIAAAGASEYKNMVNMIFEQPECARYICRKLYRWFVYNDINADVEAQVIEPMAQLMLTNDYEVQPVLEALLKSEHFFEMTSRGIMIKNPIEFVMSILKPLKYHQQEPSTTFYDKQQFYRLAREYYNNMQMVYLDPPDVAGWKAYHQQPSFNRLWINSSTFMTRVRYINFVLSGDDGNGNYCPKLDVLAFLQSLDNPYEPVPLIDELCRYFLPREIAQLQKDYLKEVLLTGLPDYEWTVEYGDYLTDPSNEQLSSPIDSKARLLLSAIFNMPEFHLS